MDRPYLDHHAPAASKDTRWSEEARNSLVPALPPGTVIFAAADVLVAVAARFGVSAEKLQSRERTRHVSEARDAGLWLLRKHSRMGFAQLTAIFGRNDHTSAIHAVRRATARREKDDWYREALDQLERELEAKVKGTVAA